VFDYNGDGRPDLLVTNMFGASQLYRNDKGGTFTDVTRDVLGKTSWGPSAARCSTSNNDGRLDLFVVDMHSDMWLPLDQAPRALPPSYLNQKYPRSAALLQGDA